MTTPGDPTDAVFLDAVVSELQVRWPYIDIDNTISTLTGECVDVDYWRKLVMDVLFIAEALR